MPNQDYSEALPTIFIKRLFAVSNVVEKMAEKSQSTTEPVVSTHHLSVATFASTITPTTMPASILSTAVKKQRPKTASPTRHGGPQQCQVGTSPILCSLGRVFFFISDTQRTLISFLKRPFPVFLRFAAKSLVMPRHSPNTNWPILTRENMYVGCVQRLLSDRIICKIPQFIFAPKCFLTLPIDVFALGTATC